MTLEGGPEIKLEGVSKPITLKTTSAEKRGLWDQFWRGSSRHHQRGRSLHSSSSEKSHRQKKK